HQHLGLADIQRTAGLGTLFDTVTAYENYPLDAAAHTDPAAGLTLTRAEGSGDTHYTLSLAALPPALSGAGLTLRLAHRPDRVTGDEARVLLSRFTALLTAFARLPRARVASLEAATHEEQQLLARWNGTEASMSVGGVSGGV
ncbi:hypothetical protein V2S66_34380, partial [Streptomyces sp. V4-01]|nr:hypothetical protein [Streptomyces sp. V4-01]